MGQFTEAEIIISTKSNESAKTIAEQINNLDEYLEANDIFGHTSITDVDVHGNEVYVKLCSDRYPNAEWQCEQILELVKNKFKLEVNTFTADVVVPETIIYKDFEDEGGEDE